MDDLIFDLKEERGHFVSFMLLNYDTNSSVLASEK